MDSGFNKEFLSEVINSTGHVNENARYSETKNYSELTDQFCACFRVYLTPAVKSENQFHGEVQMDIDDNSNVVEICGLFKPQSPRANIEIIKKFFSRYEVEKQLRSKMMISNVLTMAIGGTCAHVPRKKFKAFVPQKQTIDKTLHNLKKSNRKLKVFVAWAMTHDMDTVDQGMLSMLGVDGELRHGNKSSLRSAFFKLFPDAENDVSGYIQHPVNHIFIQKLEQPNVTKTISIVIWDGNCEIRKALNSNKNNLTWEEAVLDFFFKMFRRFFNANYNTVKLILWVVFDVGMCPEKLIENKRRQLLKNNTQVPRDLPKRDNNKHNFGSNNFLLLLYTHYRDEFAKLLGDTFSNDGYTRNKSHQIWEFLRRFPNITIGFAGVGNGFDERCRSRTFNSDTLSFTILDWTHHLEDTKLAYLAFLYIILGLNVLVIGTDTDIWLIITLMIAQYRDVNNTPCGTVFLQTTGKILSDVDGDDDVESCLINCNVVAQTIEDDVRLRNVDSSMRVLYFILLCVFLGGDTTNSWNGISHTVGLTWAMDHIELIGNYILL